jgi:hypothetical protein
MNRETRRPKRELTRRAGDQGLNKTIEKLVSFA